MSVNKKVRLQLKTVYSVLCSELTVCIQPSAIDTQVLLLPAFFFVSDHLSTASTDKLGKGVLQ